MHQKQPPAKSAFSRVPAALAVTDAMSVNGTANKPKTNAFMGPPSPRTGLFRGGHELQGRRVHAVALPGRLRSVVEHVAEVSPAPRTEHLGTLREETVVGPGEDVRSGDRRR